MVPARQRVCTQVQRAGRRDICTAIAVRDKKEVSMKPAVAWTILAFSLLATLSTELQADGGKKAALAPPVKAVPVRPQPLPGSGSALTWEASQSIQADA